MGQKSLLVVLDYGHNGADDAAYEVALLAMALQGSPVLLKWTRDDEHAWEPYGPASAVELSAKLGTDGRLAAFSAEAIGGTFRGRPRSGPDRAGPAKLLANHYREAFVGPQPGAPNMNRTSMNVFAMSCCPKTTCDSG